MEVEVSEYPEHEAVVVAIEGQCDVDSVQQVQEAFEAVVRRPATRIVADVSGVDFCDSTGLSVLVVVHKSCVAAGGWLRLAGPGPFLVRVLDVVGLLSRVPAYESVPAALTGDPAGLVRPPGERDPLNR